MVLMRWGEESSNHAGLLAVWYSYGALLQSWPPIKNAATGYAHSSG